MIDTPTQKSIASTMNAHVIPAWERIVAFVGTTQKTITLTGARMGSTQGVLFRTYTEESNRYTRKQVVAFLETLYGRVQAMDEEQTITLPASAADPDGDTIDVVRDGKAGNWLEDRTESVVNGDALPTEAEDMKDIITLLSEPYATKFAGVGLSTLKADNGAWGRATKARHTVKQVLAGKGYDSLLRVDGPFKNEKQAINKTCAALARLNGNSSMPWDEMKTTYTVEAAEYVYAIDADHNRVDNGEGVHIQEKENAIKAYAASVGPVPSDGEASAPQTINAVSTQPVETAAMPDTSALLAALVQLLSNNN